MRALQSHVLVRVHVATELRRVDHGADGVGDLVEVLSANQNNKQRTDQGEPALPLGSDREYRRSHSSSSVEKDIERIVSSPGSLVTICSP